MPLRGGGGGPLMANAILNFHFDYLTTSLRLQLGWECVCTRLCPRLAWITFDAFAIVDVGKNRIGIWNVFPWMTKWIWHRIKEEDTSQPAEGKKRIGKIGKGGKIGQRQTSQRSENVTLEGQQDISGCLELNCCLDRETALGPVTVVVSTFGQFRSINCTIPPPTISPLQLPQSFKLF